MDVEKDLENIAEEIRKCTDCQLYRNRKNAVPGEGSIEKGIMIIGEAPGYNEDLQGRPFVGKAGKLLEDLLSIAGLKRDEVFITNVVKCRPPNNRQPEEAEIDTCSKYLEKQINTIKPKIIVCVGNVSSNFIFKKFGLKFESMNKLHGKIFQISNLKLQTLIIPTYHPAAILRNLNLLPLAKEDWEKIGEILK
ncbi:MAG: type-4 uracil-DNA glycosylase [Candidatus Aenigmarchaeota archaeon]|nr:type-4 uracil-DNA glycosylase [Candidatus Aenigmarchaeota archaeon]MCX8191074.1 type-4 uracil-DNA glycosylase [Candidatus Aenigmarchaeota archaeon]MDW8160381.1 type-4 uracil-DNA glycosylase [Candidatus Aenigmarchaeota archaeon]